MVGLHQCRFLLEGVVVLGLMVEGLAWALNLDRVQAWVTPGALLSQLRRFCSLRIYT